MEVFIVIDLEAPMSDCIVGVYSTKEKAEESAKVYCDWRVGGALIKIINEKIDE